MKRLICSIVTVSSLFTASAVQAQSLSSEFRTNGKETLSVFEKQRLVLQDSSAVIYRGYKRMVYGIIVSSDGYILTKASELEEPEQKPKKDGSVEPVKPLSVRIGKNVLYSKVKVVAINTGWDVALIKIDAKDLKPITFAKSSELSHGRWVLTNGATSRSKRRVRAGVISAHSRKIAGPSPVMLGVMLEEKGKKLHVRGISPNTGAAKSDLKKDDVIVKIDGEAVKTRKALQDIIIKKNPKEELNLTVLRGDEELEVKVALTARPTSRPQRMSRNDQMSGRFSRRRTGFDRILQVDIPLQEHSCGGPLIKLDGECVGMTIARANRAETFVVPVEELLKVYKNLKGD